MKDIDKIIAIIQNEMDCVIMAETCDRDCANCELVKAPDVIISNYDKAISCLKVLNELLDYYDSKGMEEIGADKVYSHIWNELFRKGVFYDGQERSN